MPQVRPLTRSDRAEWLRMRHALWPDVSEAMHRLEVEEYEHAPGDHAVYVIDRGAAGLGGFVDLSIRDRVDGSMSERVGYVEGWYVDPDLRGRGLGRALIAAAEAWTAAHGLTELGSDAELDNIPSIRAHTALGFKETFRLVHFLKPVGPGNGR